jgi:hypothetical protein
MNLKTLTLKGIIYGAFAGLIATWAVSSVIAASEVAIGLQISTFYSVMGIGLGLNNVITAAYVGFGLHLLTGSALGGVLGAIGIRWKKIKMLNLFKNTLLGMGAGFVIWLVLFAPVTTFLIQPSIQRIVIILALASQHPASSDVIRNSIAAISVAAIAFHLLWGAIFSFIMRSLTISRAFKMKQQQQQGTTQ